MTDLLRTPREAAVRTAGLLAGCLSLAVLATALDLPTVVRILLGVPGVLLAPGYAWLTVAAHRTGSAARTSTEWVLAAVFSLGALPLVGVTVHVVGLPVTPESIGLGLLVITLPPTIWALHSSQVRLVPDDWRPHIGRRTLMRATPVALSVLAFLAAVAWGASWQERVDSGPFTELGYAGPLEDVSGPVVVRPGQTVDLPVDLARSDGDPWSGTFRVSVDGLQQVREPARVDPGEVVRLTATAPSAAGLHDVLVTAVADDTGEELTLTLPLRVIQP
jgi:hypothetical protein